MENKEVKKLNRIYKIAWLELIVAILSIFSIINVLISKEVSVLGYILNDIIIIIDSLTLAFIYGKTTLIPVEEEG